MSEQEIKQVLKTLFTIREALNYMGIQYWASIASGEIDERIKEWDLMLREREANGIES